MWFYIPRPIRTPYSQELNAFLGPVFSFFSFFSPAAYQKRCGDRGWYGVPYGRPDAVNETDSPPKPYSTRALWREGPAGRSIRRRMLIDIA